MSISSPYIVNCPECGTRATITKEGGRYAATCPRCDRVEYGDTPAKAARCMAAPAKWEVKEKRR